VFCLPIGKLFIWLLFMVLMRWYGLVSLLLDSRVKFLLGFVLLAAIVATILTIVEIRLKKKKKHHEKKIAEESSVEKLKKFLRSEKSPREKLDFLDKISKEFFKERFGYHLGASYSDLALEFKKTKRTPYVNYCNDMFSVYYSSSGTNDPGVRTLSNSFISLVRSKKREEEISKVPSFSEKVWKSFDKMGEKFGFRKRTMKNVGKIKKRRVFRKTRRNFDRKTNGFWNKKIKPFFKGIFLKKSFEKEKEKMQEEAFIHKKDLIKQKKRARLHKKFVRKRIREVTKRQRLERKKVRRLEKEDVQRGKLLEANRQKKTLLNKKKMKISKNLERKEKQKETDKGLARLKKKKIREKDVREEKKRMANMGRKERRALEKKRGKELRKHNKGRRKKDEEFGRRNKLMIKAREKRRKSLKQLSRTSAHTVGSKRWLKEVKRTKSK
jgi:hypothetical protein